MKYFLDFLNILYKTWKIVIPFLIGLISILCTIGKFGNNVISISSPLWISVIIFTLALYPLCKFIEFLFARGTKKYFEYKGLLWKPSPFSFGYPQPLCPQKGCGRKVIYKVIPPNAYAIVASVTDIVNINNKNQYVYEYPIHGNLNNVPNEDLELLKEKAKFSNEKP